MARMPADLKLANIGAWQECGEERQVEWDEGEEVGHQPPGQHHVHRAHAGHQHQQAGLAVAVALKPAQAHTTG
jgi:hypothetical protein